MLSQKHGYQVWPFYFLCDESASMSGAPINEVNESLQKIWSELIKSPAVADKAWVSVISFSDTAEVLVPLTDLQLLSSMPGCKTKGETNFGNAFRKLKQVIDSDVMNLKAQGFKVIRPVVFFMSDGEPTDADWKQVHSELFKSSNSYRPFILSFGFGSANGQVIDDVASSFSPGSPSQAYLVSDGLYPWVVFREIAHQFFHS